MSYIVKITGWKPGLKKVSMTHLLRTNCGLSLHEAKAMTDKVLEGQIAYAIIEDVYDANALATELVAIGAIATVYNQGISLEGTPFAEWLFEEVIAVLNTPLQNNQRLLSAQAFFQKLEGRLHQVPREDRKHIPNLFDKWKDSGEIQKRVEVYNDEIMDWLEEIAGTIDGIVAGG